MGDQSSVAVQPAADVLYCAYKASPSVDRLLAHTRPLKSSPAPYQLKTGTPVTARKTPVSSPTDGICFRYGSGGGHESRYMWTGGLTGGSPCFS